ncbi:FG-GAP repeat domain-containing protein, partial [Verrucomicrobiota bacterium]
VHVSEPTSLSVWISKPDEGNRVWGTAVSLRAKLSPHSQTGSMQFQYRKSGDEDWINLGAVISPPPYSFSTTWDVTGLTDGSDYELRAVGTDTSGNTVYSDIVTVSVASDTGGDVGDVVEDDSDGTHQRTETFSNDETAVMEVYDGTSVEIPMGTVDSNITVQVRLTGENTNAVNGAASGSVSIDANRDISIEGDPNLQRAVTIDVPYPDDDNDGVVDGTSVAETSLTMYWFNADEGEWQRCLSSEVHTDENYVRATTYHLTEFGLFGGIAVRLVGDYDGDGKADIAVYHEATGYWYIQLSGSSYSLSYQKFGETGYAPVPGDFDGDGKSDLAVYQEETGYWYILLSGSSYSLSYMQFGALGYTAVSGDFDADDKTDLAVYQESTGYWYIYKSSDYSISYMQFGASGYTPVPGDYDGDGTTDLTVYHEATGYWYILLSGSSYSMSYMQFGASGYTPVSGDFDADGKTDLAVYQESTGYWYIYKSSDYSISYMQFGASGYTPVPGDYDGDGTTDLTVYHEASGYWYILLSGSSYSLSYQKFGESGYRPIK